MTSIGDGVLARRLALLRELDPLRRLAPDRLERVAEAVVPLAFRSGAVIVGSGRGGGYVYAVVEGEVELLRAGERVGVLGQGEWFGDGASELAEPGTTAVARTPTSLYALETGLLAAAAPG